MPRETDSNQFRRANFTQEDLKGFSAQLSELKSTLDGLVKSMKEKKLTTIYVDGVKKIPYGLERVAHGIKNVEKALVDASWSQK